ncbi:MAG: hypothetical protein A2W01_04285 [Candidatus Solincola sediminis]|uniref:DUF2007 domain-containing protein n=1 Tax=Candidatus Solincola sediminis TaxID=1797199 RepID=A0A1F2WQM9_9ACTN|nr:MAG: hypothetical protein A2W01_04285 [Candidatus Solincola sediminis]OFW59110.1 MAG: hypothetical protein A2Y75_05120 [Candidatus Solincola sediminis]
MGFWDFLHREAKDETVVFSGDRWEAEMVISLLKGGGFHPAEWADMPGPYIGSVGMARVIVPPEEFQGAKEFLASLKDQAFGVEEEHDAE